MVENPRESRRQALQRLAAAALVAAAAGCSGLPGSLAPYRISTAQLEESLRRRAPLRHSLRGVVDVTARIDGLRMLPERERVAAAVKFDASGPLLPQPWYGAFDLLFALRYEPSDHTLRAHELELQSLRLPLVAGRSAQLLEAALNAVSQRLGDDIRVHQFSPNDVQRLRRLGLQPGTIDVRPEGLVLRFAPAA